MSGMGTVRGGRELGEKCWGIWSATRGPRPRGDGRVPAATLRSSSTTSSLGSVKTGHRLDGG